MDSTDVVPLKCFFFVVVVCYTGSTQSKRRPILGQRKKHRWSYGPVKISGAAIIMFPLKGKSKGRSRKSYAISSPRVVFLDILCLIDLNGLGALPIPSLSVIFKWISLLASVCWQGKNGFVTPMPKDGRPDGM